MIVLGYQATTDAGESNAPVASVRGGKGDLMLPVITAQAILLFVGEKTVSGALSWTGSKAMVAIFGNSDQEQVLAELKEIRTALARIEATIKSMMEEIRWEHQVTRAFAAEEGIKHKFTMLTDIAALDDDGSERVSQAESLKKGILSVNNGVLSNMETIHNVLMGHSVADPNQKGLLRLWAERCYEQLKSKSGKTSFPRYHQMLECYLSHLFFLQFIGMTLYLNAMDKEKTRKQQVGKFLDRMKEQKAEFEKYIPQTTMLLVDRMDQYFAFLVPGTRETIYGSPTDSRGTRAGGGTILRQRIPKNGDEEWQFRKSPSHEEDGTYVLVKRAYDDKNKHRRGGHVHIMVTEDRKRMDMGSCMHDARSASRFKIIPNFAAPDKMSVTLYCKQYDIFFGPVRNWAVIGIFEEFAWELEPAGK